MLTQCTLHDSFPRILAGWSCQSCKCDDCMPACFVRQTYIVITIPTSHQQRIRKTAGPHLALLLLLCTTDHISSLLGLCARV